jgi:hypothetical protein
MNENMIGWYHKDHHVIIFLDHLKFMDKCVFVVQYFIYFFNILTLYNHGFSSQNLDMF